MKGVVLDFDGVLVQTMERHAEAYRRVLAPHGVPVSDPDVFLREGARSETILKDLLARRRIQLETSALQQLANEKQQIYASLGTAPLYPGAEDLVRTLRKAVPRLALVTGTRRENLERMIPHLLSEFDALLAQDAYHHDKPHPEPYLNAANALGLPPPHCAALENAIRGVQSAQSAGYSLVVALPTTTAKTELERAGASIVASSHAEATRLLVEWAKTRMEPKG